MKVETVKDLDDERFRRLAGAKQTTFDKMALILEQSSKNKKSPLEQILRHIQERL